LTLATTVTVFGYISKDAGLSCTVRNRLLLRLILAAIGLQYP
jgi:hypothetical protein